MINSYLSILENDHDVLVYGTEAMQLYKKHNIMLPQMMQYVLGVTYGKMGSFNEAEAMFSSISISGKFSVSIFPFSPYSSLLFKSLLTALRKVIGLHVPEGG